MSGNAKWDDPVEMAKARSKAEAERRLLKRRYGALYDELPRLFARIDPVGIIYGEDNPDEYDPEVRAILLRVEPVRSREDLRDVMAQVFEQMFAPMEVHHDRWLDRASEEAWALIQDHSSRSQEPRS
jgi:hypothetical protein